MRTSSPATRVPVSGCFSIVCPSDSHLQRLALDSPIWYLRKEIRKQELTLYLYVSTYIYI